MRNAVNIRDDIPKLLIKGDFQKKNALFKLWLYDSFIYTCANSSVVKYIFLFLLFKSWDCATITFIVFLHYMSSDNGLRVGCIQTRT